MSRLRLAVVGAGHLGRIHAELARQNPLVELVAVVDPQPEVLGQAIARAGVPGYTTWQEIPGKFECAIVAAPTRIHAQLGEELLSAGLHLLIEKPLAESVPQGARLVQLAKAHQRIVQVGHVERFNPAFEFAAAQRNTPTRYIAARRSGPYSFRSTDVGVVLDLLVHDLELVLSLANDEPQDVQAWGTSMVSRHEDVCQARLEFRNGLVADLFACRVDTQGERQMCLWGRDWQTRIDFAARRVETVHTRPCAVDLAAAATPRAIHDPLQRQAVLGELFDQHQEAFPDANPLAAQQENFFQSVLGNESPRVPVEEGFRALLVADRILQQLHTNPSGTTVPFPQAAARKAG